MQPRRECLQSVSHYVVGCAGAAQGALPLYKRAADGGYDFAQLVLAMYHKNGWAGCPQVTPLVCP